MSILRQFFNINGTPSEAEAIAAKMEKELRDMADFLDAQQMRSRIRSISSRDRGANCHRIDFQIAGGGATGNYRLDVFGAERTVTFSKRYDHDGTWTDFDQGSFDDLSGVERSIAKRIGIENEELGRVRASAACEAAKPRP